MWVGFASESQRRCDQGRWEECVGYQVRWMVEIDNGGGGGGEDERVSEHELVDASPILPSGLCPVRENAGWEEEVRVWGVAARRKGRTRARATRLGLRHTVHPRQKSSSSSSKQRPSHFAGHFHLLLTPTLTHPIGAYPKAKPPFRNPEQFHKPLLAIHRI